jgi:hypothetical protein
MGAAAWRVALPPHRLHRNHHGFSNLSATVPSTTMTAQILNGLITLAIFLIPIPLLLWADRPRRQNPDVARADQEG